MSKKPASSKFAQTFPIGIVAMICGIGALATLAQNLVIACLIGVVGVARGIAALRMHTEKLDKTFAIIGTILSFVPMIYAIVILVKK